MDAENEVHRLSRRYCGAANGCNQNNSLPWTMGSRDGSGEPNASASGRISFNAARRSPNERPQVTQAGLLRRDGRLAQLRGERRFASRRVHDLPWNNSRPISMRRISLVPAPIS